MAERTRLDSSSLVNGKAWVLLQYEDRSEFCFETTLSPRILNQHGIILDEGCFVRLDKQYYENGKMVYRQFPYGDAKVSIWNVETYTDRTSAILREFI